MSDRRNIVLHCYDEDANADKIYIACVRDSADSQGRTIYQAVGKWGRRGKNMSEQIKSSDLNYRTAAMIASSMASKKMKKGYVDIESSSYDGPLTMSSPHVTKFLESESGTALVGWDGEDVAKSEKSKKQDKLPKTQKGEVCVAECLDNTGIEHDFDVGVNYIVMSLDGDMIKVIALDGEEKDCYRKRFGALEVE